MQVILRCGVFVLLVPWLVVGYIWAVGATACEECAWWWTNPIVGFFALVLPALMLIAAVLETGVAIIRQVVRWMT